MFIWAALSCTHNHTKTEDELRDALWIPSMKVGCLKTSSILLWVSGVCSRASPRKIVQVILLSVRLAIYWIRNGILTLENRILLCSFLRRWNIICKIYLLHICNVLLYICNIYPRMHAWQAAADKTCNSRGGKEEEWDATKDSRPGRRGQVWHHHGFL